MPPRHILLVEDDPDIQKLIAMSLQFTSGTQVSIASNGQSALEAARTARPEVILLDVMLPDTDGYQVIQALKSAPETADIPVIFLSARAQASEIKHGLSLGAIGYLVKPFDSMALASKIDELLTGA